MATVTSFPLSTVALTELTVVRSAGYAYAWSDAVTSTDPGAGKFNANNATFGSITALYLSETDAEENGLAAVLGSWDDSTSTVKGELRVYNPLSTGNVMTFSITGITDNGGYVTLAVTPLSNTGSFAADDELRLEFRAKGDKGEQGIQGEQGATGATGAGYAAASATSLTVGLGSKAFTTQAGLAYVPGVRARAVSSSTPSIWMEGPVASYSDTTLTITVDAVGDAGTKDDWLFSLVGDTEYSIALYDLITHTAGGGL